LASESEGEGPDRHIVISFRGLPDGRKRVAAGNREDEEFFESGDSDEFPEVDSEDKSESNELQTDEE
jgi:hypothetical protein